MPRIPRAAFRRGRLDRRACSLLYSAGAIFLKDSAMEIEFEGRKYLIVPHSAILALVRTELSEET